MKITICILNENHIPIWGSCSVVCSISGAGVGSLAILLSDPGEGGGANMNGSLTSRVDPEGEAFTSSSAVWSTTGAFSCLLLSNMARPKKASCKTNY